MHLTSLWLLLLLLDLMQGLRLRAQWLTVLSLLSRHAALLLPPAPV